MLPNLRIASPCKADWNEMQGDHRVRHCSECNLNVYNFSAIPEPEIQRLLVAKNERICARWYRRSDGTILTADCPVGFRARVKKISLVAGTALSALLSMSSAAAQTSGSASGSNAENSVTEGGVIVVRVTDESDAVIQKAEVRIFDSANQLVAEGQTNYSGKFQSSDLKSGSYSVRVVFPGFKNSETDGIVVEPKEKWRTTVQMRLDVGATMGVVVTVGDNAEIEDAAGDLPLLLPLATAPDPAAVAKPTTIRRLFSKIKGNPK